jgi:hypothetical protein
MEKLYFSRQRVHLNLVLLDETAERNDISDTCHLNQGGKITQSQFPPPQVIVTLPSRV